MIIDDRKGLISIMLLRGIRQESGSRQAVGTCKGYIQEKTYKQEEHEPR